MIADAAADDSMEDGSRHGLQCDHEALARAQRARAAEMLRAVLPSNLFYQRKFGGLALDPSGDWLDRLPFTTRAEIQQDQVEHPPYGSNLTYPLDRYIRLHQTSGTTATPLRWLDTAESWAWFKHCWKEVLRGAGVTSGDRVVFPFSFGPFIGFWGAFEAAVDLGCFVLPAGGMTTAARLRYLVDNEASVVCCTPTYALHMAEVALKENIDLAASLVRALVVAGEPGGNVPATRERIASAWGARVFDHCGMTEIGAYGFECTESAGGMHILETEFITETIDPADGRAAADGEVGELVLTNLGRWGSPLIRYRTGDLVRLIRRRCACGRSFAWMGGGILGRADDMLGVRGNNVFPSAIEDIVRGFQGVAEFRIVVQRPAAMTELRLDIEPAPGPTPDALAERIAQSIQDRLHWRPHVVLVAPGSLPRFELKARRVIRQDSSD
jgi:phenylacetate-CoA ligase